jgi:hypothetical protein
MATDKTKSGEATAPSSVAADGAKPSTFNWDDSSMSTSYANVVNVSVTREECGLFFGTNLTTGIGGNGEVTIKLSDRIIMTPHAAKRLLILLNANIRAFEERYGKLEVQRTDQAAPVQNSKA